MGEHSKLYTALVHAQRHAAAVELDGSNKHHGYRYARAESLIQEGRTALSTSGLALLVTSVSLEAKEVGAGVVQTIIRSTIVLAHESGESISYEREWPAVEQNGRPLDKAEGGALTTALGYAIRDVLLLPRDDEYADMDRRDDRGHEPPRAAPKEAPRLSGAQVAELAQRAAVAASAEPRTEPAPPPEPAPSTVRPSDVSPWDVLLELARRGETLRGRPELDELSAEQRSAMRFIAHAYAAGDEQTLGRIGAEVRSSDLSPAWREITMREIKAAWQTRSQRRGAA